MKGGDIMRSKYAESWLDNVAGAWRLLAPDATLANMTLAKFEELTQSSVIERNKVEQALRLHSAAIARREAADKNTRNLIKRVVHAVQAHPSYGPNSDLFRTMGYVTEDERKSGLTRKGQTTSELPEQGAEE